MSFAAIKWAMSLTLPCHQKMTLLALADFSNEEGSAFPSMAALAKKAGLCVRTARGALRKLEKLDLVSTHTQIRSYGQTSNFFILSLEAVVQPKKIVKFRPSQNALLVPPASHAAPPAPYADITCNPNLSLGCSK